MASLTFQAYARPRGHCPQYLLETLDGVAEVPDGMRQGAPQNSFLDNRAPASIHRHQRWVVALPPTWIQQPAAWRGFRPVFRAYLNCWTHAAWTPHIQWENWHGATRISKPIKPLQPSPKMTTEHSGCR